MIRILLFAVLYLSCSMLLAEDHSWPLDEVNGSLTVRGSTQIAAGASGKSLVLDGDSLIELNDSAKSASGEFTVSLWLNPYDLAGGQQMLAGKNRYSRNERQWGITIEPSGKLVSEGASLKNIVKSRLLGMNRGGADAPTTSNE